LEALRIPNVGKVFRSFLMRKEIALIAGPRGWGDTKLSWLARVPREVKKLLGTEKETISFRTVKSLWFGEITNPDHHAARDVRRAAAIIEARKDAQELAAKYQTLVGAMNASADANLYSEQIARLERVARLLCGEPRS
jgi:hypothetical protein